MKKLLAVALLLIPSVASAQITVSHTFSTGDTVDATQFNTNFSDLSSDALDRTGGSITGTIAVNTDVTIDGVDISDYLATNVYSADGGAAGDPSFSTVGDTHTGLYFPAGDSVGISLGGTQRFLLNASGLTVYGVNSINGDGKIPAISSTYFASLSGANLTTLNASNLSSGTVATARLGSGTASSATYLRGDGSWQAVATVPNMLSKTGNYTVTTGDAGTEAFIQVNTNAGDTTITLYAASGQAGSMLHIKKTTGANALIVDGNSSETIDGYTTIEMSQNMQSVTIICDGSNWHII